MSETTTMRLPVRLGFIGCGAIARLHAQRLMRDSRAQVVALFDESRAAAERLSDELGKAEIYGSVTELVERAAIDAVLICTPTLFHFEQVQECRRHGLHVLCEKPLADTRERIVRLIEESQRAAPVLSVSYQRRYDSLFRTLRREVQSGRWGPVRSVTTHNSERWQQTIANTWRDNPQLNPGGFLGDAGSHKIDMLFYVTGLNPLEVFAHSDPCGSHVQIVTTISGRLSGNVALSMSFIGNAQHWREDFQVHCRDADLSIRENTLWIGRDNRFERISELEPASSPDAGFLDILTQRAPNQAPPECALPVFDFTQAVLQSARTQQVVRVE